VHIELALKLFMTAEIQGYLEASALSLRVGPFLHHYPGHKGAVMPKSFGAGHQAISPLALQSTLVWDPR
jgi:hypothetical protein